MRGTAYARHMFYVHKLPIDMFYDLDELEVIVDTQHGISFVELPMDVFYDIDDLEVIVDTQTLNPSDPRSPERLSVFRLVPTAAQHCYNLKKSQLLVQHHGEKPFRKDL